MAEEYTPMPRLRVVSALTVSAALGLTLAPAAQADRSDCRKSVETSYSRHYYATAHKLGKRAPGRNIRKYGLANGNRAQCRHLKRSLRTFQRWLAPPVGSVAPGDRPSLAGVQPHEAGGGYSIPRGIVMCESGGDYGAVNGSSGARGAYQIMPSTHAGICPDLGWSPQDQDQCAARVWAQQGRGAWSC